MTRVVLACSQVGDTHSLIECLGGFRLYGNGTTDSRRRVLSLWERKRYIFIRSMLVASLRFVALRVIPQTVMMTFPFECPCAR
jgi:hypothetical protein